MTGKWHRALVLIAGIIVKVGTIVVITDPSTLGVGSETWTMLGAWLALAGSLLSDIVTLIRADAIPGVTTGVGNDPVVNTTTTTLEVKENTTP